MSGINDFFNFKWKYLVTQIKNLWQDHDYVEKSSFFTHEGTKDWILGAKALRLCQNTHGFDAEVVYSESFKKLPKTRFNFYLHQKYFAKALEKNAHIKGAFNVVMYTHTVYGKYYSPSHHRYFLNHADYVTCLNQATKDELIEIGVRPEKILVWHMASDPSFFPPKEKRKGATVGFCGAYYDRKNPELLRDLVLNMPQTNFILIGRWWDRFEDFDKMIDSPNFTYYDDQPYDRFPELYRKMDVYVSASHLEGGPVPLLEAMLSNVVPVCSKTGFCQDLIKPGENGYLFDLDADWKTVAPLIEKGLQMTVNVRPCATPHSWEEYGKKIANLFSKAQKKP